MTNYKKLLKVINKTLPERVEKFKKGDIVITGQYKHRGELELICEDGINGDWCVLLQKQKFYQNESQMTNLGKPLTILDVMAAYEKERLHEDSPLVLRSDGDFEWINDDYEAGKISLVAPLSTQEELCGELLTLFNK